MFLGTYKKLSGLAFLACSLFSVSVWADDIGVSISKNPTNFTPGASASNAYEIMVSKTGTGTVSGIEVDLSFASTSGVNGFNWSCSGVGSSACVSASGSTNNAMDTITMTLDGTNAVTIELTGVDYEAEFFQDLNFSVDLIDEGSGNTDNNASNDSDSKTINRASETDISLTVSDSQTTYTPGENSTYIIKVSNIGPSAAKDLNVSDFVATGFNITAWQCTPYTTPVANSICSSNGGNNANVNPTLQLGVNDIATITVNADYASSATADPMDYEVRVVLGDTQATDPNNTSPLSQKDSNTPIFESQLDVMVETSPVSTEYVPGDNQVYTVTVTNNGPSDVNNVSVVDNNPTPITSISWNCSASTDSHCDLGSDNNFINTTVDLESGGVATFTVTAQYDSGATLNPLVYEVTATNPSTHTPSTAVTGSVSLQPNPFSQFTVSLSDSDTKYIPGTTGRTYIYTLTNIGPSDAIAVNVTDNALPEFESIAWSCDKQTSGTSSCDDASGTTAIDTSVNVVAGETLTFTIVVDYFSSAVTNPLVYTITADNPNNTSVPQSVANDSDDLERHVDLSISKLGKVGSLVPNEPFTYVITVANAGPSDLGAGTLPGGDPEIGTLLTDQLDSMLIDHPTKCSNNNSEPCWEWCESDEGIPDSQISPENCSSNVEVSSASGTLLNVPIQLSAGSQSQIFIHTRIANGTYTECDSNIAGSNEICNSAQITLQDSETIDAGGHVKTDFTSNEIVIGTDLVVSKTDNQLTATPGSQVTYEIEVTNDGYINVGGISVVDILPTFPHHTAGLIPGTIQWFCETNDVGACCTSGTAACGLNAPTTTVVDDELHATVDLAAQTSVKFTIVGTIDSQASGTLSNTAEAVLPANILEADPSNNSAEDTTDLVGSSDIELRKNIIASAVNNNSDVVDLTYEIRVKNLGPSRDTNIQVMDNLNSSKLDLTTASWTCEVTGVGSCLQPGPITATGINTEVDLAVNSEAVFTIHVSTLSGANGQVYNSAKTTASGVDDNTLNNEDYAEYSLSGQAELLIDHDDARTTAVPGDVISYTMRISNQGPDDLFGAQVENIFPPQLQNINWTCDAVSPIPGDLTWIQNSLKTLPGSAMGISHDGSHIYVGSPDTDGAGPIHGGIQVYERSTLLNSQFGQIFNIQELKQAENGLEGIEMPKQIVVSPSDRFVYVLSLNESGNVAIAEVAVFARVKDSQASDFGELSYQGIVTDHMPEAPQMMQISPDGKHVYLSGDGLIQVYNRDANTGALSFKETVNHANAGAIIMSYDGTALYVADANGANVTAYSRNNDNQSPQFGALVDLNVSVTLSGLSAIHDMAMSGDDRHLYLAAEGSQQALVISRDVSDNSISLTVSYAGSDLNFQGTETLAGVEAVSVSADGEHVIYANHNDSSMYVLSRNSQGFLSRSQQVTYTGLAGLSDAQFTPDGRHVLTTARGNNPKTLSVFERRQPDPLFAFMESERNGDYLSGQSGGQVDGLLGASAIVMSHDGKNIYATGLGSDAVVQFRRDSDSGTVPATAADHLTFEHSYFNNYGNFTDLKDPDSIAITPNDQFVFVASSDQSTLTVLERDNQGDLSFVTSYAHQANQDDGLLGVSDMVIDNSGQNLYITARYQASVSHYKIANDGSLSLQSSIANGDPGVSGLAGAMALTLSQDQAHVYVASAIDDAVVILSRNVSNGGLQFKGRNLTAGDQPRDVAVSNDGAHIYVVSANDSKISIFQRIANPVSDQFGQLSLIKTYQDGTGGFNYLSGVRRIAISPDDTRIYVAAEFDDAITILDRDDNPNSASFGYLTVVETQLDGLNSDYDYAQPYDLITSYDGRHVYVAGFADHAINGFILGSGSSCAAQGSGNIQDRVDIGANGTLTYHIDATIRPNAVGQLMTQGRVIPPPNFTFINNADNCPTDSTQDVCDADSTALTPMYDLSLSKDDGRISAVPGQSSVYEIVVSNHGPSDAISRQQETIQVFDVLNQKFDSNSVSWTCEAIGSGSLQQTQVILNSDSNVSGLFGVAATAYSENLAGLGPHLLTVSVLDNTVSAFAVDELTGELTQVAHLAADGLNYLAGARDVLVLDDDIYVTSQVADAVVQISAVENGGSLQLQFQQAHHFANGIIGLNQALALAASADGAYLYAAGANDASLVVFRRDLISGTLTFVETIQQGMNGADGLSGINDVAVAQDGLSVYTLGLNQSAIGIYQRDTSNGELNFQVLIDETLTGVNMSGLSAILVSGDNRHVYATSAGQNKLFVFSREITHGSPNYGEISLLATVSQGHDNVVGLLSPANLNLSADGRHLYVAAEQADALLWFSRDTETGLLTFAGILSDRAGQTDGLNGVMDIAISDDGSTVYAVASQDHAISAYQRRADSQCPASGTGNISLNSDTAGVPVSIAAQGQVVFRLTAEVASNASGQIINEAGVFACPQGFSGAITDCVGSETDTSNNTDNDINEVNTSADLSITKTDGLALYDGLLGAVRVTGNNEHLYTAARGDNAIGVFSRINNQGSLEFGQLHFEQSVSNGQAGVSGLLSVSDVILHPQGETVYAAGSGDNSVVAFRRDLNSGQLSFLEKQSSGVFGVEGLEGVSDLAISADGAHLYATGPLTGSLTVFAIDQNSGVNVGRLSYKQNLQNAVAGVSGLATISDVVVAPDGKHVYVVSNSDNSVSVFLRNPNANSQGYGELSYVQTYRQGDSGIGGLVGPTEMIMSSQNGGDFVYILGAADASLVVFSRDPSNGDLSFVEYKQNGTSQVEGLSNASHLVLSADESALYVAGQLEDALVRFDRDMLNGTLQFAQAIHQGDPLGQPGESVRGLDGVSGLFATSDGRQVFTAAAQSNALSSFSVADSGPALGALSYAYSLVDGEGGVAPGSLVTYVIIARNDGPSDAEKVIVKDIFPPEFSTVSYECFPVNGASCRSGQVYQGNVNEVVDLPAGSQVEIIATGQLRPDAIGLLSNTATVMSSMLPDYAISDPNMDNNAATDNNTLLAPAVDLVVTKDNGLTEVIPGTQVTYEIIVRNENTSHVSSNPAVLPSDARQVLVTDIAPESISDISWTCSAYPEVGLLEPGEGLTDFVYYQDLDSYADVVVTVNGAAAYALGQLGTNTVLISYERDSRDGELIEVQRILSSDSGINGLVGGNQLALSHDQRHLYVSSPVDDALLTFSINAAGELNFEQVLIDGVFGVNGLGGVADILISADDRFIYAAGSFDDGIGIFSRSLSTGLLTQQGFITGTEGLNGVQYLALHGNGQLLFATAELNESLAAFERNHSDGLLTPKAVIQNFQLPQGGLLQPTDITTLDNRVLVTDGSGNQLTVFNYEGDTDQWSVDQQLALPNASNPSAVVTAHQGQQVYLASAGLEAVSLHPWRLDNYQSASATYDSTDSAGLVSVQRLVLSSDGAYIYAFGDNLVVMAVQDGSSCKASGKGQLSDVADIVANGYISYQLTGWVLDSATGQLTNSATALTHADTIELYPADNIATDSDILEPHSDLSITKDDGLSEVVAGTDLSYTLDVFSTGPSAVFPLLEDDIPIFPGSPAGMESGTVQWTCEAPDPIGLNIEYDSNDFVVLDAPTAMQMNGAGDRLLIAGGSPARISLFEKTAAGELLLLDEVVEGDNFGEDNTLTGLTAVSDIRYDQQEEFVYVADTHSDAIYIFTLAHDNLQLIGQVNANDDGVVGLLDPVKLLITPDNSGMYVAAKGSHAITVFSRHQTTGQLTFVERVKDGFGTIVPASNVIIGINDLAMTPDGRYLYTAAGFSDAIAIFSRNLSSQVLTFEAVLRTGDSNNGGSLPAMDDLNQLMLSPNAAFLYALSPGAQRLLIFRQTQQTGALSYVGSIDGATNNGGSLILPASITLSPDSGNLLLSDEIGAAINLYERDENSGLLSRVDTYFATDDPGLAMTSPESMVTDGDYVFTLSPNDNTLTVLRLVAEADCLTPSGQTDNVAVNLYMKPISSAQTVVNARVHPSARGEIINQATIIMPPGSVEDNPIDNLAEDRTQIIIETDVAISKSAPLEIIAGETIEYIIVLTNSGPSDALGVQVIDDLDSHLTQVSWVCEATGRSICQTPSGNGDLAETVNVTIDGTVTFTVNALVDPYFTGQINNGVEAVVFEEGFNTDTDLSNNTSSVTTDVRQELDMSVTKELLTNPVVAGETVDFEIVVSNHGPSASDQVMIIDTLMNGLSHAFWTCTPSGLAVCNLSGQGGLNQLVDIPPGEKVTYLINAMLNADALGSLENTASIQVPNPVVDVDLNNNSDSISAAITQLADVEVQITDNIDPFDPDSSQRLIYNLKLLNHGPSTARDVYSISTIPALQDDILIVAPGNSCQLNTGQLICVVDELAVDDFTSTDASMLLLATAPGQVVFESEVSSAYADPYLMNNEAIETTDLISGIDVRIQKTNNLEIVEPGAWVEYQITVDNIGSVDAGDVIISENLPAGLIHASWQCQAYGDAICINVNETAITGGANLPAGTAVVFSLKAQVDPALAYTSETEVVNEVTVQLVSGTETSLTNNIANDIDALILYIFKNGFEQVIP